MKPFELSVIELNTSTPILSRMKYEAGKLVHTAKSAPMVAATRTVRGRKSKPFEVALLSALVCGALCDQHGSEYAEKYTQALATVAQSLRDNDK